jgi:hypothetical protein
LQFLQAWQGSAPVHVAENMSSEVGMVRIIDNRSWTRATRNLDFSMAESSGWELGT